MVVPVKPFFFPSVRSCHTQGVGYLVRSGIGDDIRLFGKTDAQKIFLVLYDHNNHPALFFAVCLRKTLLPLYPYDRYHGTFVAAHPVKIRGHAGNL